MSSTYCKKVTSTRVRFPQPEDYSRICCQLNKAKEANPDSDISLRSDPHYVARQIVDGAVDAYILDEAFLVAFAIGTPWYADRLYLHEYIILRIGEGSNFDAVCDLLDDIAVEYNVDDIFVGTALAKSPRALVRKYERRGYSVIATPSLIKRR